MKAKKAAVLILALVTVFTLFGLTASAEELASGDYGYVLLEDGTVKITAYNGSEAAVTVPDTIDGRTVTVIGAGAFDQAATVESLVIPGCVKELETGAVSLCAKINSITIQEGELTELTSGSIKSCAALKKVSLPSNVTAIGTFEQCLALDSIAVASGNKSLKSVDGVVYSADMKALVKFPQGKKLAEYYIPTSVTKIANNAFYEVQSPVKVYIPLTLKEIEGLPFAYSKVTLYYEGSSVPAAWKEAVSGFTFTVNGYKLKKTDKITSTPGGNSIKLKWNSVYGANCYRIYYKSGGKWKTLADVKSTSYTVNGTKYGTTYTFAVKAGKTSGKTTTWTNVYTTYTVTAKIPATTKVTSTQTASAIKLSWNAVKGVDGYKIYYKTASGWKALGNVTATTVTYKNLKAGSVYTFAVKAGKVVSGKVMWSDVYTTHKTATTPAKPDKVTATQTTNSITLNWSSVKGATAYRIYYKNGNGWSVGKDCVTGTTHTFKNLKAGAKYTFAVRSYIQGDGGIIWGSYTTYTAAVKPVEPTVTVKSPAVGQLNVKWNSVKGATEYRLYYKKNNGSYKLYKTYTSPQNLTFKNLASGVNYTFVVRAGVKTSGGVVLSSYTPKALMVPYKTTKYLNMLKSGVFAMAYTVDGVTQVMCIKGQKLLFEYVDEKGRVINLIYDNYGDYWMYVNHSGGGAKGPLSTEISQSLPTPYEISSLLSEITIPSSFKKTTYKENGYTYDVEYYYEDGIRINFYYYGAELVGIEEINEAGEGIFISVQGITDNVPDSVFRIPDYDEYDVVTWL